ncbi:hypothetical protein AAFF_G00170820 [Aldrovandia affinis]|uniref:Immunoglobulin V-set domain-containing protein n=1 Tax=Aldrovandia affinis TaxID=143900 RepID=A0AAD7RLZ1_9TELE|nr:hypothetical protein AAFF_G00170820 [Aldrovandia affinis]
MKCLAYIFSLLAIHHWTALANKNGGHGTRGESLVISCPYADDFQNARKYFCRKPCHDRDVLVKGKESNNYTSSGRYSLYDNRQAHTFTVTISWLALEDTGVYYCGIERWFIKDTLQEVHVTVSRDKAPVTDGNVTESPLSGSRVLTEQAVTTATHATPYLDGNTGNDGSHVVGGGLGVLVFLFLVALAVLLRRRSASRFLALKAAAITAPADMAQDEEGPEHVYDEMMLYSTVSFTQVDDSTGEYCTVQFSDLPPEADEHALYSLVTGH